MEAEATIIDLRFRVNHNVNTDDNASYDSDDLSLSSSDDLLRSGTLSSDLDNRDVDELNYGIDDDDDSMEPASEPVCFRACVRASLLPSLRPSLFRSRIMRS